LHPVGPHHVAVSGTCTENVYLGYLERVTIQGAPNATIENAATPNPQVVVVIEGSRGIVLRNLTISGGSRGIVIRRASEVRVEGCTIENNRQGVWVKEHSTAALGGFWPEQAVVVSNNQDRGISAEVSSVSLDGFVTVENNGWHGLSGGGSEVQLNGHPGENVLRGNNGLGINLVNGSAAGIQWGNRIENNQSGGLQLIGSTAVIYGDEEPGSGYVTIIENNPNFGINVGAASHAWLWGRNRIRFNGSPAEIDWRGAGIQVSHMGTLWAYLGATISNNAGPGILADASATVQLLDATINNNGQDGVRLEHLSVAEFLNPNSITGNSGASVFCDTTSLAYGDLTGIAGVACGRTDHRPPRPQSRGVIGPNRDLPRPPR
jgi:parallel beta-helix repeat protein